MRRWGRKPSQQQQSDSAARAAKRDLDQTMTEDALTEFSIEELREFLEADLVDTPMDPEFKERLRQQLWELVKSNAPGKRH